LAAAAGTAVDAGTVAAAEEMGEVQMMAGTLGLEVVRSEIRQASDRKSGKLMTSRTPSRRSRVVWMRFMSLSTLSYLATEFESTPSAGSPDCPSLHLREQSSSMKNRKRENCTSVCALREYVQRVR
jgi:hypothetical protein